MVLGALKTDAGEEGHGVLTRTVVHAHAFSQNIHLKSKTRHFSFWTSDSRLSTAGNTTANLFMNMTEGKNMFSSFCSDRNVNSATAANEHTEVFMNLIKYLTSCMLEVLVITAIYRDLL